MRNAMLTKLSDVHPNPYRDPARFPVDQTKIAILRSSIRTTGFWDNVVGRCIDGRLERAYGEHRWTAALEEYGPDHEVDLIVKDLSDEMMLRMMAHENMEEFKSDFSVTMETVRAVVMAYGAGQIRLSAPQARTSHVRYAPSFIVTTPMGSHGSASYTVGTIEKFLGWNGERVPRALQALGHIEQGLATEDDFQELNLEQATALLGQINRRYSESIALAQELNDLADGLDTAHPEHDARAEELRREAALRQQNATRVAQLVASTIGQELREGRIRTAEVAFRANEIAVDGGIEQRREVHRRQRQHPEINVGALRLANTFAKVVRSDTWVGKLDELLQNLEHLEPSTIQNLQREMKGAAERIINYADRFVVPDPQTAEGGTTLQLPNPTDEDNNVQQVRVHTLSRG
jgi:hypothetical protein